MQEGLWGGMIGAVGGTFRGMGVQDRIDGGRQRPFGRITKSFVGLGSAGRFSGLPRRVIRPGVLRPVRRPPPFSLTSSPFQRAYAL